MEATSRSLHQRSATKALRLPPFHTDSQAKLKKDLQTNPFTMYF
jgi:hypothetical protein